MFGKRLQERRKAAGLTQEELAEAIHVSPEQLGRWENGHNQPKGDTIARLADLADTTADYLLGRTTDERSLEQIKAALQHAELQPQNQLEESVIAMLRAHDYTGIVETLFQEASRNAFSRPSSAKTKPSPNS